MNKDSHSSLSPAPDPARRVAVVGAGRMGTALAAALAAAGRRVEGPLRRGAQPSSEAGVVLLCVSDEQIDAAAAAPESPADPAQAAHAAEVAP